MTFPRTSFYPFIFPEIRSIMVLPICGKTSAVFVIIGGETNFSAACNQLVNSKSKTYCQNITL